MRKHKDYDNAVYFNRYYNEDFHDTSDYAASVETDDIEGSGCFVAGTKIFTSLGWKPIEKIKKGTIVVAYDKEGNIEHGYVQRLHVHKKDEQKHSVIKFTLADDTVLEVTANHGMWQDDEETPFIEAKELRVGDTLFKMDGEAVEIVGRKITALKNMDADFKSYNLTVTPQHTYIAEGIKVHNGGGDKGGQQRTPVESPNTLRSKALAKVQEVISEGEIEGLVDDGRSVFFDDTPILNDDDSPNFEDVAFIFFEGTPDQDAMPGFSDVEAEQAVGIEMLAPPSLGVVRQVPGGIDAVRCTVRLPNGIYFTDKETGDIRGNSVGVQIETRLTGGVWEEQMATTIRGKSMSTYETAYRVDAPSPYDGLATWEVRVSRTTAATPGATEASETFFHRITEIQEIQIPYENTAVSGVTVNAKSTGGQVPRRTYDVKGIKVKVPTNYDPITRIYTGAWDGSFKVEWTDNPAWVVYDLLTNTRYGLGEFVDEDTIDKFSFYDAAVYNDELVPDGDGGDEPRFTFNTQLSVQDDSWKTVQHVASTMRSTVLPGTIITLLQDRPGPIAKLITNANVLDGLFSYTGSALATRKTVAHVSFNDPLDRYLPKTVSEEDSAGVARYGFNPVELVAFACTSEGQARRLAKWALDTELNTAEVCVFNVSLDNADLLPGDIIKIMDRDYVGLELSGRVAGGTTTVIDLDREVTLEGGETYTLSILDADGQSISERTVTTGAGDVTQVTVTPAFEDTGTALANNVWMLESDVGVVPRQFRVLFMRELEKGIFEVSATQHDPDKYARVETGITVPPPVYSDLEAGSVAEVTDVVFELQAYTDPTFGQLIRLVVNWDHVDTYSNKFQVQWRLDDGTFSAPQNIHEKQFEIDNIVPGTYEVMIAAVSVRGISSVPVISEFTFSPAVTNTMSPPINLIVTPDTQDGSADTFANPDLTFRWENNPVNNEIAGQGIFGGISGYTVVIKDASMNELETRLVDSVTTNDPYYIQTFTFAQNAATVGGPHRELNVEVFTRTADGAVSTTAITDTFTNPFPPAPGLGLQDNPTGSFATVTPTGADKDTAGCVICIRDTAGDFTPLVGDIVYQGPDLAMQIPFGAPLTARSVKAAVYDDFSFSFNDLVFSTVERQEPSPYGITSVTTLPTLPDPLYPDGVVVYLTTDRKLYRVTLNGTVWDRSADGADITPNSITTNEIAVGTITAANIETGTITAASGVIADAAIETANIADLNVNTINVANGAITNIAQQEVGSIFSPTSFAGTSNGDFPITGTRPKTYVTIASVPITIDSTASDIIINCNFDIVVQSGYPTGGATRGSEFCGGRITRDGIRIWEGLYDIGRNSGGWTKDFAITRSAAVTIDGGISGPHTYALQVFGQTEGSSAATKYEYFQNTIVVTEVKK
jgi:hypothetical protein